MLEQATGKYVWICGDDDVIEPSGLAKVLSYLDSADDYDIVCLRARGFNGEYQPQLPAKKEDVVICRSAEDLACQVHVFFTFISGIIVTKSGFLNSRIVRFQIWWEQTWSNSRGPIPLLNTIGEV